METAEGRRLLTAVTSGSPWRARYYGPGMGAPLTAKYDYAGNELQHILEHAPTELRGP